MPSNFQIGPKVYRRSQKYKMSTNWPRSKGGWPGKLTRALNDRGDEMKVPVSIPRVLNKRVGWLETEHGISTPVGYGTLHVIASKWSIQCISIWIIFWQWILIVLLVLKISTVKTNARIQKVFQYQIFFSKIIFNLNISKT